MEIVHTGRVQPTADDVRRQLDRILASEGFTNADRMTAFLRYVVERSLSGEGDQVKEYVVGIEVFGRDAEYDPRLDSIVRVEARRLRTKLDEYYAGPGSQDPVLIQMRRGSYVPAFEERPPEVQESHAPAQALSSSSNRRRTGWQVGLALALVALVFVTVAAMRSGLWATVGRPTTAISIAVLPFAEYSTDPEEKLLAARLTDGVTGEIARIGTVGVVSHTSALQFGSGPRRPSREIAQALRADVLMEGSVSKAGNRVNVNVRLVNGVTDRKMWVKDFTGDVGDPRELERRIATAVVPVALEARGNR
jgi:TolB-like protein